jgi:hypothetical protein
MGMRAETEADLSVRTRASRTSVTSPIDRQTAKIHALNIIILLAAIIVLFWRVFFLGETLIDVNTLNNQLPWGYSAGTSNYPYNRRDLTDTYVTRDYFVASAYQDGEFPLWNPYTMAGHPIYADGVTRTLSPFLLVYRFFDVPLGYSLARLFELMLGVVFLYLFLIKIGIRAGSALMGSIVFAFSAHSMLHLTGLGWWGGLMWLPLVFLFADLAIQRRSQTQAILSGFFLAMSFFCGYLPNQIYYVGAVVLYYVFFAVVERRVGKAVDRIGQTLAMMTVTLAVGLTLSATQWVPSLELLSYSNRKIVGAELGYVYLPPWYSITLVFPNLFGEAYDAKILKLFTALGVSHDHILYLGIAALAPLGFALYWLWTSRTNSNGGSRSEMPVFDDAMRRRAVFFAMLAGLSLVLMMAAPLYVYLTRFIPILQVIRVAVRAGVLFLFAATVLVAIGTDLLMHSRREGLGRFPGLARKFVVLSVGFVAIAVVFSYLIRVLGITADPVERGRWAFVRKSMVALSNQFTPPSWSIIIPLALIVVIAIQTWAFAEKRISSRAFLVSLASLLMIDLFWNSNQFDHTFERSRVFPRTEITDLLRRLPPGRVLVAPAELETNRSDTAGAEKIIAPPNTLLPYRIPSVTGKNQQFPKWYREFASLIEPQLNLSHVVFDQYRSPFFDILNVRYVMTRNPLPPTDGYKLLTEQEGTVLYENLNTLPRAFFAREIINVGSPVESLDKLRSLGFNPAIQTVVEDNENSTPLSTRGVDSNAPDETPAATIVADTRNSVLIETDNVRDGLLVLSDNFYPGWSAAVDGTPARILRANHTMRAIRVPAGRHLISFVFMPTAFFLSLYVSLSAGALTLSLLGVLVLRNKRRRGHDIRQDQKDS